MIYKHLKSTKFRLAGAVFALALVAQAAVPLLIPSASAGTLTNTLVRVDRLSASQSTGGMVCAKAATTATEAHVQVAFPGTGTAGATSFGVNATAANWTVTTTNLPSGSTAWIGIGTATAVSGATVTFPSGDMVVGTLYCFNFSGTSTLSTPTAAASGLTGTVTTQDSTPSTIDSGTWGIDIVASNADQVTVNATVNPSFTMALANRTDNLGTLTVGSVSSSPTPPTATINTNAANGWYFWGIDSNQGLKSTNAGGYTVGSNCSGGAGANSTLSAGTEGYNVGAVATSQAGGTGTVSIDAIFVGGSHKGGGLCSGNYQSIATSNGTASNSVITLTNNAAISGITKAATDYTDTETFVGAGLF